VRVAVGAPAIAPRRAAGMGRVPLPIAFLPPPPRPRRVSDPSPRGGGPNPRGGGPNPRGVHSRAEIPSPPTPHSPQTTEVSFMQPAQQPVECQRIILYVIDFFELYLHFYYNFLLFYDNIFFRLE